MLYRLYNFGCSSLAYDTVASASTLLLRLQVTNEYEPYTFNDFGSKIPLQDFRPTTTDADGRTIVIDAAPENEMNVFMVMDEVGDYEVR